MNSERCTAIDGSVSQLPDENDDDTIARIMRLSEQPGVISFAGGFPAPEVQNWQALRDLTMMTLNSSKNSAFRYGPTSGITKLRELLASRMRKLGRTTVLDEILITAGGVAGLDLIAATYLKPGDNVIVGSPSYLGALQVFRNHRVNMISVPVFDQGLNLELLEQALIAADAENNPVKYIYTVPSFDNPTGVTTGLAHRQQLIKLATTHGAWILEDGAYQELYFESPPDSMLTALEPDCVIHINTFSKMLCPGFRLGWIVAPAPVISRLSYRKQGWDQCASTVGQHVAVTALSTGYMEDQLELARKFYLRRCNLIIDCLGQELGDIATWNVPEGGFYIWMQLPTGVSAEIVSDTALTASNVAVLPGTSFYAKNPEQGTLRLCFSSVDENRIEEGIKGLRNAVISHLEPELRSLAS